MFPMSSTSCMELSNESFLFRLPSSVTAGILSDWIQTYELTSLDNALVNHKDRKSFLEIISHTSFVTNGRLSPALNSSLEGNCLEWLKKRQLKVRSLILNDPSVRLEQSEYHLFQRVEHLVLLYFSDIRGIIDNCRNYLQSLDFYDNTLSLQDFASLAASCPKLHTIFLRDIQDPLSISMHNDTVDISHHNITNGSPYLLLNADIQLFCVRHLSVSTSMVTDVMLAELIRICPNLVSFELRKHSTVTDAAFTNFGSHCHNLEVLSIIKCKLLTDIAFCNIIRASKKLVSIALRECSNVTDASLVEISYTCLYLKSLCIRWCKNVSDAGIVCVVQRFGKTLVDIDISENYLITDASVSQIAEHCTQLQSLNISENNLITDAALFSFSLFADPSVSTPLDLITYNTAEQNEETVPLRTGCVHLSTLDVSNCTKITAAGLRSVLQSCPQLKYVSVYDCGLVKDSDAIELTTEFADIKLGRRGFN